MTVNVLLLYIDLVRVYDGNEAFKRRQYRTVSVPKHAPVQLLLVRNLFNPLTHTVAISVQL